MGFRVRDACIFSFSPMHALGILAVVSAMKTKWSEGTQRLYEEIFHAGLRTNTMKAIIPLSWTTIS